MEETTAVDTRFEDFFKGDKYREKLSSLNQTNQTSLHVDFPDLALFDTELARDLINQPEEYLERMLHAAFSQLEIEDPAYANRIKTLNIRLCKLYDTTLLRKMGSKQIRKLIMVKGIVVKSTVVKPKTLQAAFECKRCGVRQLITQTKEHMQSPTRCENPACGRSGPFDFVQEESEFIDSQDIWIQELPEQLPPGQLPRSLHIKIVGDIVETARPGDYIAVVGIVQTTTPTRKVKLTTFNLCIIANSIEVIGKEQTTPSPSEIDSITSIAKDPFIHKRLIESIAPSIYGYEPIKEAIMYLCFGGQPKELGDIKIRGELNVLLIGDPGTAKSQLLRYVASIAPRGIYTSGKGTTGVGLTAACIKDQKTGEWTLEAGALVLADKGIACIDEIDKMNENDRVAIHETLEQHTVSVAKGGIVATLNARTAVLAAANPSLGRYDAYLSIIENINLPVTLLSRFDLIFLMRDVPDLDRDKKLSKHILALHRRSTPQPPIPPKTLRKYISYAKSINPELTKETAERLEQFYLTMRKASEKIEGSPIIIGPRQLEALVRLAEARARSALREQVTVEDAEAAILLMNKSLSEVGIDVTTGRPDIDILMTGKPKSLRDKMSVVLKAVTDLTKETSVVEQDYLLKKLEEDYKIQQCDAKRLIGQLIRDGVLFNPRPGYLKKV